jgi:RNA polymerase primary sigma factor
MPEASTSSVQADGLRDFLRQAARTKRLSAAEELELARRMEHGDARARDRMIKANLLLVVSVAKRYSHPDVPLADLIQEGSIGLIRAVDRFDYRRGNRFSTYAVYWIRQFVWRAVAEQSRLVRLPATAHSRLLRLRRLDGQLRAQMGRAPTPAELADSAGMARAEVEHLLSIAAPVVSLDEPARADGAPLRDLLPDAGANDQIDSMDIDAHAVHALLGGLSPRQREVVVRRFGLAGHHPSTREAIAQLLGVTRSRVQQVEREALDRLHRNLRRRELPPGASPALRLRAAQQARWA